MQPKPTSRRAYGSGSLVAETKPTGATVWIAQFRVAGRKVKRTWPRRPPGGRDGLTRTQAEERLRDEISQGGGVAQACGERLTVAEVGARYITQARRKGRKPSTIENLESEIRVHLAPFFTGSIDAITGEDVADLIDVLEGKGLAPKTIKNVIATLSALFTFACAPRRRWATSNPCVGADLPAVDDTGEIRFLTIAELDLLVAHARRGIFQEQDRVLYVVAAMTGLRLGELVALRWRDVDWTAARIRVRQNYVRGRYGSPKSKRSTRSVPMADEVGGVLDRLFQTSHWQGESDLVFAHQATGGPLTKANITRRLHKALADAGLDETHVFHDLRHTFGTRMAAAGVPVRTLQEWMGHKHLTTTQRYADYAPSGREAELVAAAFARSDGAGFQLGSNLSESEGTQRT
jgi:integrase